MEQFFQLTLIFMMVLAVGFFVSNYPMIARAWKLRLEQKEEDLRHQSKMNHLKFEEEKLRLEFEKLNAPFEAESKALRTKSEEEHKQLETARKKLELELKNLMLPETAKIESVRQLAEQQERLAQIEIEKAKALADIEAEKILESKMGEFEDYRQAKIKEIETKIKVKEHKMKANEEYLEAFIRQEDYNGNYDDEYTFETPDLPYKL